MAERIRFKVSGEGKQLGMLVGDWLVCSLDQLNGKFKIYRLDTGIPLLKVNWDNIDDAIKFAEWLDSVYKDYFEIWEAMPEANIFQLAQWTIRNGVTINSLIDMVREIGKKRSVNQSVLTSLFASFNIQKDVLA